MILLTSSKTIFLLLLIQLRRTLSILNHKHFLYYLNSQRKNSIFIHATDSEEIANAIISTLNINKSSGPNSIPYKILNLLKKYISKQFADLFNLYPSSGVFPSLLKIANVVLVYKTDSKLDWHNYRPISLSCLILKIYFKN